MVSALLLYALCNMCKHDIAAAAIADWAADLAGMSEV